MTLKFDSRKIFGADDIAYFQKAGTYHQTSKGLTIDPMTTVTKQCFDESMLAIKNEHSEFTSIKNKSPSINVISIGVIMFVQFLVPNKKLSVVKQFRQKTSLTLFNNEFKNYN